MDTCHNDGSISSSGQNGTSTEQNPQVNGNSCGSGNNNSNDAGATAKEKSLRERVDALREMMTSLKEELLEEKALWRKEIDQITSLMTAAERCTGDSETSLLDVDYDLKQIAGGRSPAIVSPSDLVLTSPIIRDYEEKITRYQGALAQAQAEKRFNIRRQIAANSYRKRLSEVEKLCQEELAKVRETATHLEPLKQIASEWSKASQAAAATTTLASTTTASPTMTSGGSETTTSRRAARSLDCGGDFLPLRGRETQKRDEESFEVPVKQIDASLVMDEDASNEIKGKIVLQIGSLPSEVPTICYSAKFE